MPIPTYDGFIWPLLKLLADRPDGVRSGEAYEALGAQAGLTDAERRETLPSGRQPVFHNRIGWAQDRIKRHGLSESLSRGLWRLTPKGRDFLAAHPTPDADLLASLARVPEDEARTGDSVREARDEVARGTQGPEERIERAVEELHGSIGAELLEIVFKGSPTFFERLVLDVLSAMGYGADQSSIERTGGTGDGGIDGIIALDRLGLEKVAVQAKRWKDKVGRPEIQAFYGALAGQRVRKGVFITTSAFTSEARNYAAQLSDTVVLVDGRTLAGLMIEFGVGVTAHRTVTIPRIDSDYFDE